MLKKLFALLVLLALVAVVYVYWKGKPPGMPRMEGAQRALDDVGDKLRETKVSGTVKAAIELDRELRALPIDVDATEDGGVTLRGEVPRPELKAEAERVAAAVPGVKRVVNELRVNPSLTVTAGGGRSIGESVDDKALEAKVRLAFSLDTHLEGTDIDVRVFRREVTLGGEVDREAQRALAVEIARRTDGVASVTEAIRMRGSGTDASPASTSTLAERAGAAQRALAGNANLSAYGLKVQELGGRLLLTGKVKTGAERDLAGVLAREAAGVAVDNAVEVGP